MTINGGTFETDRLINHTAVTATVSISDPTGGVALTVGTANGSSTFDGLIQDGGGGAGNLEKVGTGTFTLTGANTYTGGTIIDGGTLLVNNASWKGFAAGECLFLGASGSKRGSDDWEITFRFAATPNKTGLTVGDIVDINKKG